MRQSGISKEIFQQNGFPAKDDHSDFSSSDVLLVFKSTVYREKNIKFGSLRRCEELAVFQSRKASVTRSLTFVPRQVVT